MERLVNAVLTPLNNVDADMELPPELINDITTFIRFAGSYYDSFIRVTHRSSNLNTLAIDVKDIPPSKWYKRVVRIIRADQDREELAMLSDGIKNVVDELQVSHQFAEYNKSRTDDSFYSGKWGGGKSGSTGERSGGYFTVE